MTTEEAATCRLNRRQRRRILAQWGRQGLADALKAAEENRQRIDERGAK